MLWKSEDQDEIMLKKFFCERACNEPTVMALGGFDGAHIGHKILIDRAKSTGRTVGIMTITGGKSGKSLFTALERACIFRSLGVDFALELEFEEIKDMSPEKFIAFLGKECNAETFVCGEDFRFGKGALGTPKTIEDLGKNVFVEKILYDGDEKVGSSLIKRCLEKGEIERANTLLGFPFFLQGEVVKDRGVGALIGFPTANIPYPEEKFPLEKGVYESRVFVDGKEYKGITNYGARPTFDNDVVVTETHLISYMGNLYGKTLQVQFIKKLRENKKFENVEKLKEQLEKDVRRVTKDD